MALTTRKTAKFEVLGVESTIAGLKEFAEEFGGAASRQTIRAAMLKATTPTVKALRTAAPRGRRGHKLRDIYGGLYVAPGHLSRNIGKKARTHKRTKNVYVLMGAKKEAFYGTEFVQSGVTPGKRMSPRKWLFNTYRQMAPNQVRIFNDDIIFQMQRKASQIYAKQRNKLK